jgi:hypothetical protein
LHFPSIDTKISFGNFSKRDLKKKKEEIKNISVSIEELA